MKSSRKTWFLVLVLLFLHGCSGGWVKPENRILENPDNSFSVTIPPSWIRYTSGIYADRIMITLDGPGLQRIEAYHLDHEMAFEKIEKSTRESMLPSELADLMLAEMKASEELKHIELLDNRPAVIGNHSGFRLHTRERNIEGLRIDRVTYAFADQKGLYVIFYEAPKLNYFEKSIGVFEDVVRSFKQQKL